MGRRAWRLDHYTVGMVFASTLLLFTVGRFFLLASHTTASSNALGSTAITVEHFAVGRRLGAATSSSHSRQREALEAPIRTSIAFSEQYIPLVGEVHLFAPTPQVPDPVVCTGTLEGVPCTEACKAAGSWFARHRPGEGCILPSPVLSIEDQRTLRNALYSVAALQQGIYGWQDWSLPVYSSYTLGGMPDDMDTTRVRLPDDLLLRGSVLHLDTDAAGAALQLLQQHIASGASVVGYHHAPPDAPHIAPAVGDGAAFVVGHDPDTLPFADASFDAVLSLRIPVDTDAMRVHLQQAVRVLKPGGLLYIGWPPPWSSARGHGVTEPLVAAFEAALGCKPTGYMNDGTFIQDWSHILASNEFEFQKQLFNTTVTYCAGLVEHISDYVFRSSALNRMTYSERIVELRKVQGLAMVQTASLNAERYVVDSALEAQLHAQLPGETHFGVGEAVMIMAKAA